MADSRPCIASLAAGIMTILKTDNNPGLQVYYQGAFKVVVRSNHAIDHLHIAPQA